MNAKPMNEHPILFSTPMVQANLYGRKTMTRRICKTKLHKHKPTGDVFLDSDGKCEIIQFWV